MTVKVYKIKPGNTYLEGEDVSTFWYGGALSTFGLTAGAPDKPEVRQNLELGFSPDGRDKYVRNAGRPNRVGSLEVIFPVPKSLEALLHCGVLAVEAKAKADFIEAVKWALDVAEVRCARIRRGKNGVYKVAAKIAATVTVHTSARPAAPGQTPGPNAHAHVRIIHLGVSYDGKIKGALDLRPFFRDQRFLNAVFLDRLAANLRRSLGARIVRQRHGFRIVGVPASLVREWSARKAQIDRTARANTAKAREAAARETRAPKSPHTEEQLRSTWLDALKRHGVKIANIINQVRSIIPRTLEAKRAKRAAILAKEEAIHENGHFTQADLFRRALTISFGKGVSQAATLTAVERVVQRRAVVYLAEQKGEKVYSTKAQLRREAALLRTMDRLERRRHKPIRNVKFSSNLTANQREVTWRVCTSGRRLDVVEGRLETKTVLRELVRNYEAQRTLFGIGPKRMVFAVTHTGSAAQALAQDAVCQTMTADAFLEAASTKPFLRTLLKCLHRTDYSKFANPVGRLLDDLSRFRKPTLKIPRGSLLIIGHTSAMPTKHMQQILRIAEKRKCKVVLSGNRHEMTSPLQASGAFRHLVTKRPDLVNHLGAGATTTAAEAARRDGKDAVTEATVGQELLRLRDAGGLVMTGSTEQAMDRLLKSYARSGAVQAPHENLIVCGSNRVRREMNTAIQELRKTLGEVTGQGIHFGFDRRVYQGDRLVFRHNEPRAGYLTGTLATIAHVDRKALVVITDAGKRLELTPKHLRDADLGYALTHVTALGQNIRGRLWLLPGGNFSRQSLHSTLSSAEGRTNVFIAKAHLARLSRDAAKRLATEIKLEREGRHL
jgi:conjugative relaxase-like TrwC/TraI family protein